MKKVLITGSNGFIGRHLATALLKRKIEVTQFDRANHQDVTRAEDFSGLAKVDTVFHLAAVSGYSSSNENISLAYLVNVIGTVNVLEYCRPVKAKLIFPSTYVYDRPYTDFKKETDPVKPTTHYSFTKFLGEELCRFYGRVFGVNSLILRTANVYGPGQEGKYLVPVLVNHLKTGQKLVLTKPEVERSFIYIDDLVEIYLKLAEAPTQAAEIFNVGPAKPTSLVELVQTISKVSGKKLKVNYSDQGRPHEVDKNRINNTKLKTRFQWQPKVGLAAGLKQYLNQ
jgi:nucleoside-diphosphate-sugar epimerase